MTRYLTTALPACKLPDGPLVARTLTDAQAAEWLRCAPYQNATTWDGERALTLKPGDSVLIGAFRDHPDGVYAAQFTPDEIEKLPRTWRLFTALKI